MIRSPRMLARILGVAFAAEGVAGVIYPALFQVLVLWLQSPPAWPWSVLLRALVGLALLCVEPVRSRRAVQAVGLLTLAGALLGFGFPAASAELNQLNWRLPALVLFGAGLLLVWGSGRPRTAA